jgi:hypothetical protein
MLLMLNSKSRLDKNEPIIDRFKIETMSMNHTIHANSSISFEVHLQLCASDAQRRHTALESPDKPFLLPARSGGVIPGVSPQKSLPGLHHAVRQCEIS